MKKRIISLFLAIVTAMSLVCVPVSANGTDLSTYALSDYNNNQLNNSWADKGITLTDTTDENGVVTTTSSYSGELAAGKRIATFDPWKSGESVGNKTTTAYTMHFGFTVNEITAPLKLTYNYKSNSTSKDLISFSDSKVAWGDSIDSDTYIEVTAPYTIDIFTNIDDLMGYVYVNNQLLGEAVWMAGRNDTTWNQVRVTSLTATTDIKLVTTAANCTVYNTDITIDEVIKAYIGDDMNEEEPEEPVIVIPEEIKPLETFALDGYFYNQLNNNWADGLALSDVTDENGVITTTATYEGTLAKDKQIATFDAWKDSSAIGSEAPAYTMHLGFTVEEISDPVYLQYRYRNSGSFHALVSLSDSKVVAGDKIDGSTFVDVQLPYTINIFMNTNTCDGYVYVNDQCIFEGDMNYAGSTQWRQVVVKTSTETTDFKLVTTAANSSVYNEDIAVEEIVKAYTGDDLNEEPEEPEVEVKDETDNLYYSGVKYMADYTLNGYNNKQINNGWVDNKPQLSLSESVDEATGVITNIASYSGDLDAGKRIASFQPWEEYAGLGANASEQNIFHFGFTVNEITSPLYLEYNYSRDGGAKKTLISLSDSKVVVGGSMDGENFVEVQAPYTINIFMNIKTYKGEIYVNDQLLYKGAMNNSSADKKWREVRVISLGKSNNIKLVTTKANSSLFSSEVAFSNVVDYVLNRDEAAKTNWIWKIDGFNLGRGDMKGAVDGVSSITGNNTDGYVLQPNSINASHYGFARYFLSNASAEAVAKSEDDKVLWQSFEYNPTVLTNGQLFEIRGGNAYQTLIKAIPATETEPAYLSIGSNKVAISSDKFYKIDFIVNNKDYEYYILVDGKIVNHDSIWDTRQPLWNTVFSSYTTDEKMTIKNMSTTLYDSSVSVLDIVSDIATSVYADVNNVVYDEEVNELVVTAALTGDAQAYEEGILVYAMYVADGTLLGLDCVETYSEDINTTEFGRKYPYGVFDVTGIEKGTALTIKTFVWNSVEGMKSLSSAGKYTYTIPEDIVEEEPVE